MYKQKGIATVVALVMVASAFVAGLYFKHFTQHIDHPIEQVSEKILDSHGVEVDFSESKKKSSEKKA